MEKVTKSQRAFQFRERLSEAMRERQLNRTTLAERSGVDRSTVSQLLGEHQVRLPSGHVVAELATALGVTTDWLLGLTSNTLSPGEILRESLEVAQASAAPADANIERWLQESAGAKIRNAPTTLPEFMKTQAVMELEYASYLGRSPAQAKASTDTRLNLNRATAMDYELAVPQQRLEDFARRSGIWAALDAAQVREQLLHMAALCDEFYPSTRLHLYDLAQQFSAPVTVFGQRRAVIYIGSAYFVFNTREHVETLTRHFDQLVRNASVLSHESAHWLRALADTVT
ncbi:helix-turn-helix transcriptional regulator [Comamonadaceae bacterium G21597-S1]|nr:helix-turn-helix transcriptional regulator [Comamonadaceae bacterium G21597-S1]